MVNMPDFGIFTKRILFGVFGIIAIILLIFYGMSTLGGGGSLSTYFEQGTVNAGEETRLILELYNPLDKDVKYLSVIATPVDPNTITIPDNTLEQNQANFGKGEKRVLKFEIFTNDQALEGSYAIEIRTVMDADGINIEYPDLEETRRIQLHIER